MAKNDKVAQARKLFVQARAEKTGKTSAQDRARFSQRFEKLATTKEGRAKIQQLTGLQGVRKELKSAYSQKASTTTSSGTKSSDTTSYKTPGVGVKGATRSTEAQGEMALRAEPKSYKVHYQGAANKSSASKSGGGLGSAVQAAIIGGQAVAILHMASLRGNNLSRIAAQNPSSQTTPAKGITSSSPKKKGPTSGPKTRTTGKPRSSSLSSRARGGGSSGGGGGGPRGTDDRQVVQ